MAIVITILANQWWSELSSLNQCFFGAAAFFTLIFIWQFVSSMMGFGGGEMDVDFHGDFDADGIDAGDFHADMDGDIDGSGAETVEAFRLFSIRAVMAFCMLFSWAAALHLENGRSLNTALVFAMIWGLSGWLVITILVNRLKRMAESGNSRIESCVGASGTVYMDIPAGGTGQIRVRVSGSITMINARCVVENKLSAGTPVRVLRVLDGTTVVVEPLNSDSEGGKEKN